MNSICRTVLPLLLCFGPSAARAETPEEWVKLGAGVHGDFGAFIPVGIRIGLDAMARLKAQPRELSVLYYSGDKVPCPCAADGVMLAVNASRARARYRSPRNNRRPAPSPSSSSGRARVAKG